MSQTTEVPTLAEFLLARIAEDEADATRLLEEVAALSSEPREPWRVEQGRLYLTRAISLDLKPELAEHIARHDPARVLRECEAMRRIVDQHKAWPVLVKQAPTFDQVAGDGDSITFRASQQMAWLTEQEYRMRFGTEPPTAPMLRTLASVYRNHPDFREEWKV